MGELKIDGETFYKTLDEVHRHAGKKKDLPALNGVNFSLYQDRVVMEATDRFSYLVGQVRTGGVQDLRVSFAGDPDLQVLASLDDVKSFLSALRSRKVNTSSVELELRPSGEKIAAYVSGDEFPVFVLAHSGRDFPDAKNLIPAGFREGEYTAVSGLKLQGRKSLRYCFRHGIDGENDLSRRPQLITQETDLNRKLTLTGCVAPARVDNKGYDYPELAA